MSTSRRRGSRGAGLSDTARRRITPLILLMILAAILLFNWFRRRGTFVPMVANLTVQSGQVTIVRADAGADPPLGPNDTATLQRGDDIRTSHSSQARIDFGHDESVELSHNTRTSILDLYENPISRASVVLLGLEEGGLLAQTPLGLLSGRRFEIETNVVTVRCRGGRLECTVVDAQHVRVRVDEGAGTVSMGDQSVNLKAGQGIEAVLGQPLVARSEDPQPRASFTAPATPRPPEGSASQPTLTEREKTLFPPALTPTLPGDDMVLHTVQPGETLYGIARGYGVPWERLYEANRDTLASPETIQVGQTLRIPSP